MKIQIYTDDGYQQLDIDHVSEDLDVGSVIETLYDKGLLTAEEVNTMLPSGFEVVEPEAVPQNEQFKSFIAEMREVSSEAKEPYSDTAERACKLLDEAANKLSVADELIRKLYARNLETMRGLKSSLEPNS